VVIFGTFCFLLGVGLSFKTLILPIFEWASEIAVNLALKVVPRERVENTLHLAGGIFLLIGFYLAYRGVRQGVGHIIETLSPGIKEGKVDIYMRRQQLAQGPRIVALGGGTGLSTFSVA
jgi:hypothetical protein